jgi:protein required for attachment to host cells
MPIRILVADQADARIYELSARGEPLAFIRELQNSQARLHERDLVSDRPARRFANAPNAKRRGSVVHHATGGESTQHKHLAEHFARELAEELEKERAAGAYDHLVIMAAPAFLGMLRSQIGKAVQACVVAEVHHDLVHQSEQVVREHLPKEVGEAGSGRVLSY